jgi:NAD(P)-dependent dehydrogenase (short-subunit alcohol dehydrogenase family)
MAADYVQSGIRVNCVAPGTADTPWISALLSKSPDPVAERMSLIERQPMGRLVTASEVAHAIAYLASPLAGSTTGTVLRVDSGIETIRTHRLQSNSSWNLGPDAAGLKEQ